MLMISKKVLVAIDGSPQSDKAAEEAVRLVTQSGTKLRGQLFAVLVLPSLTQSGRVRSNLDLSVKREFFEDLFLNLSLYYSTDNKAPDDASADDWGVVTSVEYQF